jgi:hypothetical protein
MSVKKWATCAFLFFICYLILNYLNKETEAFGGRRRGGYYGRRGYGYTMHRGYYGRNVYPALVDNYYPSYLYPNYLYSFFY